MILNYVVMGHFLALCYFVLGAERPLDAVDESESGDSLDETVVARLASPSSLSVSPVKAVNKSSTRL